MLVKESLYETRSTPHISSKEKQYFKPEFVIQNFFALIDSVKAVIRIGSNSLYRHILF